MKREKKRVVNREVFIAATDKLPLSFYNNCICDFRKSYDCHFIFRYRAVIKKIFQILVNIIYHFIVFLFLLKSENKLNLTLTKKKKKD